MVREYMRKSIKFACLDRFCSKGGVQKNRSLCEKWSPQKVLSEKWPELTGYRSSPEKAINLDHGKII
jgi:hypothetical protein